MEFNIRISYFFSLFIVNCSLLIVNCSLFTASAQEYKLNAGFRDIPFNTIYLISIYGDKTKTIDSSKTDFSGGFHFKFTNKTHVGQYRLSVKSRNSKAEDGFLTLLDFIYNKENIEFFTFASTPLDSMHVISSAENDLYFRYIKFVNANKKKIDLLNYNLSKYPKSDDFYKEMKQKVDALINERIAFNNNIIQKHPNTLVAHILKIEKNIQADPSLSEEKQDEYMKLNYFSVSDFTDSLLINTNALTNKVLSYLSLYRVKQSNKEQQEIAFIRAVDIIMKYANQDKKIYEFVLDFLITGFENFEFNKVINYIADNSKIEDYCLNENDKSVLETKIDSYKKFVIGKSVPDISVPDVNGNIIRLSDINTDYVLVIFWASWCPHCEVILPDIKELYISQKVKKFEILAVSIDEKKKDWLDAVNKLNPGWLNCAELKGWDGKSVKDFDVYATPTLYLVDKNRTIIAKPMSIEEIKQAIPN
jgi:thiol-disulfide isomerase/thioredoxin